jgi:ATP-dependent DNA helicase PIF1
MRAAINWLFPDNHYDASTASNNTILATTNDEVDKWNDKISSLNPCAESIMFSKTWFSEVDDLHGNMKFMLNETALNNINRNGVPPHQLRLKVDDICILMQNINVKDGITNNTRVRILRISNNVIVGRTLTEKPKVIVIPRVRFRFRLPYAQSYELVRSQFPLRRAFALTYNKSQGQTLKKVLLDVRTPLFAHGFLYIGLSRVQHPKDVAFFVNNYLLHSNPSPSSWHNKPVISNVVYSEVFNVNI